MKKINLSVKIKATLDQFVFGKAMLYQQLHTSKPLVYTMVLDVESECIGIIITNTDDRSKIKDTWFQIDKDGIKQATEMWYQCVELSTK